MKFRILLILLFAGVTSQAQSTYTKWALEAGGGIHGSSGPYLQGFSQSDINLPQVFGGGRYMFNENFGLRGTIGYLSMSDGGDSNEFKTHYYRGSLEVLVDLNELFEMWNPAGGFTILLHGGGGLSRANFKQIDSSATTTTSPGKADNLLHYTAGIMPQYQISEKISLFADFSYFGHISQSYTWDGHAPVDKNGEIWMASIGIVFNLKSARKPWDCTSRFR